MKKDIRIYIQTGGNKRPPLWLAILKSALFAAILFGPGVIIDSAPMQWAGFIVMLAYCAVAIVALSADGMTIDEARKKLDELEAKG